MAAAGPEMVGLRGFALLPALSDLSQRLQDPAHAGWQTFQKRDLARWIALTMPRYLQRSPHEGERTGPDKPEGYLWGRGIWLVGAAVARSVKELGHGLASTEHGAFQDMPSHELPRGPGREATLSTEADVPDALWLELSRLGFNRHFCERKDGWIETFLGAI